LRPPRPKRLGKKRNRFSRQPHAPGIVECPNGDLLASWYTGSEDSDGDASIWGARKRKGESNWSEPFLLWDTKGFTDLNTCMMIVGQNRLWLFWPTIIGGSLGSAIMNYAVSTDYSKDGPPQWDRHAMILLKPADLVRLKHNLGCRRDNSHEKGISQKNQCNETRARGQLFIENQIHDSDRKKPGD
jgi:hypothetical protein